MRAKHALAIVLISGVSVWMPSLGWTQSFNASITGTVSDPTGAAVPGAELTVTAVATGVAKQTTSGPDGLFSFPNLQQGAYELMVAAKGFQVVIQRGITVNINETVAVNVKLALGTAVQTVEVNANASPLNFENAEVKQAMTPQSIGDLPLIVGGNQRSAAAFAILMPGVSTGGGANPFDSRINGGLQMGDEAVLDGVTMQQGLMNQSGMVSIFNDMPISPDAVSEVSVLTSNYEPQYGSTTSAVITAVTKSGTNEFHGSLYELLRNTALNARQFGAPERPKDLENDFGGTIGGPVKIPWLAWTGRRKTYFFVAYDRYYIRGGTVAPVLSIPSLKERQGDFTDWTDSSGNLIPVYDPATTTVDPITGKFSRQQFMGCNGTTPNVICPTDPRLVNSLAPQWFQLLPTPTFSGALNNYVGNPISNLGGGSVDHKSALDMRFDEYVGDKNHISFTVHRNVPTFNNASALPTALATEPTIYGSVASIYRVNFDHTFTPTVINNVNYGYLDFSGSRKPVDLAFTSKLPQIPGVAAPIAPPQLTFQDFNSLGNNGFNDERRPTNVINDLLTWVRGNHTLKFGGEYRALELTNFLNSNASGTFNFSRLNTGLTGVSSGNAIASFLLGQVDSASSTFYTADTYYARGQQWNLSAADTWKVTPKLSINYGLRWDVATPSVEKFNRLSFFDPLGPNPGAGNRPGRLAFAGTKYGAASFGREHPEFTWYHGFSPRLGIAYTVTPRTVVRTGYGIFYTQAFYPGWSGGMAQDGFNSTPSFSSSNGGLTPAFILGNGFPQNFQHPPIIDPAFLNGQNGPTFRPFDANRLSYSQQWNLTVEHQFTNNFYISTAYVGNKGTRLPSQTAPLNALNPSLLSMGQKLFDQFKPSDTTLDGIPIPYAGWVQQMTACPPTVAQALEPYPQYCGGLAGLNENAGNTTYNSLQIKAEKRFSGGVWFLGSYTLSKLIGDSDATQTAGTTWSGAEGTISPFERHRNKALAGDDVPQLLSLTLLYELPFGKEQRFLNKGGVVDKLLGGWELSTIFRASSGIPFFFRSSVCNVPSQFRVGCIPAILPGAKPFAQDKGNLDPNKPLFNTAAFEPADSFNFYYGNGPRISNLRGFGYHNQDIGLIKNTRINERVKVQFRAEFFNAWNWHILTNAGEFGGGSAFITDVASPSFGIWNGSVSAPRNVQLGMKILF